MLPRADLTTTRPAASLEAPTPVTSATDSRQEIFRRLTQISIGKELQATVDAMFDDGTFLVKVADTTARMALPTGTRVGDTLDMVFVAREPRPTFLLMQQGSTTASLSTTARLVDHLLQTAEQNGAPTALLGRTPIITTPTEAADPKAVAISLFHAVDASGLFYESHLHEWISGSRTQAEMAAEPQARFERSSAPAVQRAPDAGPLNIDLTKLAAALREPGSSAQALLELVRDAQPQPVSAAATDADILSRLPEELPAIDRDASRIINLQLNTLEQHQVRWQGELWPGQPMEWEIQEDKHDGGSQAGPQPSWTSTMRFELPHLGEISATVRLVGSRAHVQVSTASDEAASSLRQQSASLADALEAAGAPLDSFSVKRNESA
ncbi:MAG TPA: flagellar hook-length control protein FliK [Noviherbaspirillum sp.]|uniref:flagellar hook-length control protein FliK n=1 Tax=Noviherbaspirillum sp. TaxID=1926288 RepID=UPI002B477165|nr:flagellar hook-length control protein FliK [Noviherbaspirillum sp.]HJV88507.1 flagellar hook-length control protein FliK [Noviherbaspirillum sp.]